MFNGRNLLSSLFVVLLLAGCGGGGAAEPGTVRADHNSRAPAEVLEMEVQA